MKDIIDNMPGAFIVYRADKENDEILLANNELLRLTGCKTWMSCLHIQVRASAI